MKRRIPKYAARYLHAEVGSFLATVDYVQQQVTNQEDAVTFSNSIPDMVKALQEVLAEYEADFLVDNLVLH